MASVPDKPALEGLENKWIARWEDDAVYRFDRSAPREQVYAIDTPPPTVSGSLHVGHAHRRHRALPAHARPRRVLSDGLGRQRPAHGAARSKLLRRTVRSLASVRSVIRAAGRAAEDAHRGVAAQLRRAL